MPKLFAITPPIPPFKTHPKYDKSQLNNALDQYQTSPEVAFPILLKFAQEGSSKAQTAVAAAYASGRGVEQSSITAVLWYEKAIGQNNAEAMFRFARHCQFGDIRCQDSLMAIQHYKNAAGLGHVRAMYHLGRLFYYGNHDMAWDPVQAHEWFTLAANEEDADATYYLGLMHQYGNGVEQNDSIAFEYHYTLAIDKAHAGAIYQVWKMYQDNHEHALHFLKDQDQAFDWLKQAADKGYVPAMFHLGKHYNALADYPGVIDWWSKAAIGGHTEAANSLMKLWGSNEITEENSETIVLTLKEVADKGNAKIAYQLAMESDGFAGEKAHFDWLIIAATKEYKNAAFNLANIYVSGSSDGVVKEDVASAVHWYGVAARKENDWEAVEQLIKIYSNGRGNVPKNVEMATYWQQKYDK